MSLNGVNDTLTVLANTSANEGEKLKKEKDKRKKVEEECDLLNNEIQKSNRNIKMRMKN